MTNATIFADALLTQITNPDCSYLTGMVIGGVMIVRVLIIIYLLYLATRIIDKLALNPFLDWLKKKIYKKSR